MKKWKKAEYLLNIIIGADLGVLLGTFLWEWIRYKMHPEAFMFNSAPWYVLTSVIWIPVVVIAAVCLVIKAVLWYRHRNDNAEKEGGA